MEARRPAFSDRIPAPPAHGALKVNCYWAQRFTTERTVAFRAVAAFANVANHFAADLVDFR